MWGHVEAVKAEDMLKKHEDMTGNTVTGNGT